MFKHGYDETSVNAPDWYAEVSRQLERDNYEEAARIAKDSAQQCKGSGDQKGEVQALCAYTKALLATDDVWNAKRSSEQALEVAQNLGDKSLEGAAMHQLARTMRKDPQERRIASMLEDRAVTFSEMCARLADKGLTEDQHKETWKAMPSAAVTFAEKASKLFADVGNKLGEASVLITSAGIALKGKQLAEAQDLAEAAVARFQELGDRRGEAAALYAIYEIRVKDDLVDAAVAALDSIVECYRDSDSNAAMAAALLLSAEMQRIQGDLHGAVSRAADSAQYFHEAVDGNNKAQAVLSMAKSFLAAEQFDDTSEAATAAVELFKVSRNKGGQAQALSILSECLLSSGKHAEAVYRLEEAAFLYRQRKDKRNEASMLTSLSSLQMKMVERGIGPSVGEPLRHARRAVQLFDSCWAGESLAAAQANGTVAKALYLEKDAEEAAIHAEASRAVYEKLGNKVDESASCALLAQIAYEAKDKEQGQKMAQRSLELATQAGDQGALVVATNLVTNQGKKKAEATDEHTDMDIIHYKVRIARFDDFEGRRARYSAKSMDGAADSGSSAAIADAVAPAGQGPQSLAKVQGQKVEYAIRWQLVKNLNLSAMPVPPASRK